MKTTILSLLSLLTVAVASNAGVDLGSPGAKTPYDGYMAPVKRVMGSLKGNKPDMERVNGLMREALNFRYSFTEPYVAATPEVTAATKKGDCKAKSLWLDDQMGDSNVRFVVGKTHRNSKLSHAWLMWQHEGQWFILDPTNTSRPIAASKVSDNDYIPLFSWAKSGTYKHSETGAYLAGIARKDSKALSKNKKSGGSSNFSPVATANVSAFFHR